MHINKNNNNTTLDFTVMQNIHNHPLRESVSDIHSCVDSLRSLLLWSQYPNPLGYCNPKYGLDLGLWYSDPYNVCVLVSG